MLSVPHRDRNSKSLQELHLSHAPFGKQRIIIRQGAAGALGLLTKSVANFQQVARRNMIGNKSNLLRPLI